MIAKIYKIQVRLTLLEINTFNINIMSSKKRYSQTDNDKNVNLLTMMHFIIMVKAYFL